MAIRRHRRLDLPLDAYDAGPLQRRARGADARSARPSRSRSCARRSRRARRSSSPAAPRPARPPSSTPCSARSRRTSASCWSRTPPSSSCPGANGVGLIAVKGELGEAKVTANELLQSALRLRPDRIVLGELRGAESVSFLRAINTGHPGSFSTIHANSAARRARAARADGHADRHRPDPQPTPSPTPPRSSTSSSSSTAPRQARHQRHRVEQGPGLMRHTRLRARRNQSPSRLREGLGVGRSPVVETLAPTTTDTVRTLRDPPAHPHSRKPPRYPASIRVPVAPNVAFRLNVVRKTVELENQPPLATQEVDEEGPDGHLAVKPDNPSWRLLR